MSSHIVLNNTVIQILWILSIYSLIRIASTRIVPRYSIFEWNYKTNVSKIKLKGNIVTLLQIYGKLISSSNEDLATIIRDEMSNNASIFFNKPTAYFVKYRSNRNIMSSYFDDPVLIDFFVNPKEWSENLLPTKKSFFSRFGKSPKINQNYMNNLKNIISRFENELLNKQSQSYSSIEV